LWSAKHPGKGSLDPVSHGGFHGSSDLDGKGLDDSGDVHLGHWFSWDLFPRSS
jgi:hypothetical protein